MVRSSIGRYNILDEIDSGGFGTVYRGFDPAVGRVVAIKVLLSHRDAANVARFKVEASAAGNLSHNNIVKIYDFGADEDEPYLVMEYLDGIDLRHLIGSPPELERLTMLERVEIMVDTAEGLRFVHKKGFLHRDVKPANVMRLKDGSVKILDFGIARQMRGDSTRLSQTGAIPGSIPYMAPELFQGGEANKLSDIWAYGVVFYELLAGAHPFAAPEVAALIHSILHAEPQPLTALLPHCPQALQENILRLLSKEPTGRTRSLDHFLEDIKPIVRELKEIEGPELAQRAQGFIEADELDEAESLVERIRKLDLDSSIKEVRRLRALLDERYRLRELRPQINELLRKVEEFADNRQFSAALEKLDEAKRLDPGGTTLTNWADRIRQNEAQATRAEEIITLGRTALSKGDLTGAFTLFSEADAADPGNNQCSSLIDEVKYAMHDREVRAQHRKSLEEANYLILIEAYEDAVALLTDLAQKTDNDEQVVRRLAEARQFQEAKEAKGRLEAGTNAAKGLLKSANYEEACRVLEGLEREHHADPVIEVLLAHARERLQAETLAKEVENLLSQARDERASGQFDDALQLIQRALELDSASGKALALQRTYLDEAQADRDRKKIEAGLQQYRALLVDQRLEEALDVANRLVTDHPRDPRCTDAKNEVQGSIKERDELRKRNVRSGVDEAKRLLKAGQLDDATSLLGSLTVQFPSEVIFHDLLDRVGKEKSSQDALNRLNAGLNSARTLLKDERFEEACQALEEMNRHHPGNPAVAILLTNAREMWQRQKLTAEVETLLQQARGQHANGRFDDALGFVRAALDLDPAYNQALTFQKTILSDQEAEHDRQKIAEGLEEVRGLLKEQQLEQAVAAVAGLGFAYPQDARVIQAKNDVAETLKKHQEKWKRDLRTGIEQAESLLADEQIENAIGMLEKLAAQFPGEPAIDDLLRRARQSGVSREAKYRLNAALRSAELLLKQKQFDQACRVLEELDRQNPNSPAVEVLLSHAREQLKSQQIAAEIEKLLEEALGQQTGGNFEKALQFVQQALELDREHGASLSLQSILRREQHAAGEHEKIAAGLSNVRALLVEGKLETSLARAEELAALYPGNPEIVAARYEAAEAIRFRDERQAVEAQEGLVDAEHLLSGAQAAQAIKLLSGLIVQFPKRKEFGDLLDRARRVERDLAAREEIQKDIMAARDLAQRRQWDEALSIIDNGLTKRPGNAPYSEEREDLRQLKQKDEDLSTIEAALKSGDVEQATSMAEAASTRYPGDPRAAAGLQAAMDLGELKDLLDHVRRSVHYGRLEKAGQMVAQGRARFPDNAELRQIGAEIEKMRAAHIALQQSRFGEARALVKAVLKDQSKNAAALGLLGKVEFYEGLAEFDRLIKAEQFDSAKEKAQQLVDAFPRDALLQEELERSLKNALRLHEKKKRREEAQTLAAQTDQLDRAIELLEQLLSGFPGDQTLTADLESMRAARVLREERVKIDERIGELEALFREGNAEAVRRGAKDLLAQHQEPRATQLLSWAEKTIAKTREIRKKSRDRNPILLWGGIVAAVIAVVLTAIALRPPPPPLDIRVWPDDLTLSYQAGGAEPPGQSFQVQTEQPRQQWTALSNSPWLLISKDRGLGTLELKASVDRLKLPAQGETGTVTIASGAVKKSIAVHLIITKQSPVSPPQFELALTSSPNPSSYSQPVTLKVAGLPADAPGTVLLKEGPRSLRSGKPRRGTVEWLLTDLSTGSHKLTVIYQSYASAVINQTVSKRQTNALLTSPVSTLTFGQKLTLLAKVEPPSVTGSVALTDGTRALTPATVLRGGTASFEIADLPVGQHTLVAAYNGDDNNASSTSALLSVVVSPSNPVVDPSARAKAIADELVRRKKFGRVPHGEIEIRFDPSGIFSMEGNHPTKGDIVGQGKLPGVEVDLIPCTDCTIKVPPNVDNKWTGLTIDRKQSPGTQISPVIVRWANKPL